MINTGLRVCILGSGTRFLSGISYYTQFLANTLAGSCQVSVILMRRLLPAVFYPGRQRVGARLTETQYASTVRVFDGVDWFWVPSLLCAMAFMLRQPPQVLILQWWSGTVVHSYLALALLARLWRARVIIEFHEVLDTGEARLAWARSYVRLLAPLLIGLAHGFVIHSESDRDPLHQSYRLGRRPVVVIPHGSFGQYRALGQVQPLRQAPPECCNFLFFGVIRPFKGLEDLVRAFESIPPDEIGGYWLTVVGETWEGWTLPIELIARSRYADRITLINRYVRDDEVAAVFAGADAVVLPYHRSSASGPLHTTMSYGLPVVVTSVGGLPEAVAGYAGALLVPPQDPAALGQALRRVALWRGQRFADPHSWERTAQRYRALFATLGVAAPPT